MYFFKNENNAWILGENINSLMSKGYTNLIIHDNVSASFANDIDTPLFTVDILQTKKNVAGDLYASFDEFINIASSFFAETSEGEIPTTKTIRIVETIGDTTYVGYSVIGEATSGDWNVKKIVSVGGVDTITYGSGTWDDRATLTYL